MNDSQERLKELYHTEQAENEETGKGIKNGSRFADKPSEGRGDAFPIFSSTPSLISTRFLYPSRSLLKGSRKRLKKRGSEEV